jgi:CBS domain-containing protein
MNIGQNLTTESVQQADPMPPLCVDAEQSFHQVLLSMAKVGRGAVLVCRQGVVVGIFTERDALRLLASGADMEEPIERSMSPQPVTIQGTDTIGAAIRTMSRQGYRRLPIVDESGGATGLLDVAGIIHWLVQHFPAAVYNLPPVTNPVMHEREGP